LRLQRPKNPEKTKGVRADPARGGRAAIPAFPAPPEYVGGVDEYLGQIANSEQCDCPTRVKAAVEVGTLYGLKLAGRMQRSLQVHLAFEDALERYARRFPPPEAPLDPKWEKEPLDYRHLTIADQFHMEELDRLTPEQRARLDELLGDEQALREYLEQLEREGAFAPRQNTRDHR
jgi:hypothetical protein